MAVAFAVKNGNWSDSTVWNGGSVPTISDDVYANTYSVTVDTNITVNKLSNGVASGVLAGGKFVINADRQLVFGDFEPVDSPSSPGLISIISNCVLTITGQVKSGNVTDKGFGVHISNPSVTNVTVNTTSIKSEGSTAIFSEYGDLTLISGDILGGDVDGYGVHVESGDLDATISGEITGGTGANSYGIYVETGDAILDITGDITGGSGDDSTAIFVESGLSTIDQVGSIVGGSGDGAHGVLISVGSLVLDTSVNITAGSGDGSHGVYVATALADVTVGGYVHGAGANSCGLYIENGNLELTATGEIRGGSGVNSVAVYVKTGSVSNSEVGSVYSGAGTGSGGIRVQTGSATLNVNGSVTGAASSSKTILVDAGSLTLTTTGPIYGGAAANAIAVNVIAGTATITTQGVFGGTVATAYGIFVEQNSFYMSVGSVYAGTASPGVFSSSNLLRTRIVDCTGASAVNGVRAIDLAEKTSTIRIDGDVISSSDGTFPIVAGRILLHTGETTTWTVKDDSNSGAAGVSVELTDIAPPPIVADMPQTFDVRSGVHYGGGVYTGTLKVPGKYQVSHGVPVDNTIGLAAITLPQVVNLFGEQIRAAFDLESGIIYLESTVYHGSDANKARPENLGPVIWVGSVEPLNALDNDVWVVS